MHPLPVMPAPSQPPLDATPELDLRQLYDIIRAGRWIILAVAAATVVLASFYLWITPPIYRADALVQVETDNKKSLNAALGDVAELLGDQAPVTAEIEILKSRMVIGKVIDALNLEISAHPRYFPVIGRALASRKRSEPPRWGLGSFAWGGERIVVKTLEVPPELVGVKLTVASTESGYRLLGPDGQVLLAGQTGALAQDGGISLFVQELVARPGGEFIVMRRNRSKAFDDISQRLAVTERGKQSGILAVTYEDSDRDVSVQVVNGIVEAYQKQNVERRSAEAQQTLAFLNEQLPKLREKVETAEAALNQYRLRQGSIDLTKETELILQHSVELQMQREQLMQKREELTQHFTANHPTVQTIDAQMRQIERDQASIANRVKGLPDTQQELLRLSRDVQVNSALYTQLLNSAQELQVAKAGTVGNVRIIDKAVMPIEPAKPKKVLVLAIGAVLGLLAGVLVLFVRRALNHGVEDPTLVEQALGLPTYATVPYSLEQKKLARTMSRMGAGQYVLAQAEPHNIAIEALRSLRTSLHFAMLEARNNVVALTGPAPNLGKSFLAINFGAILASSGKRVVVVDADLRRGHLHEYVGRQRSPGVSEFVAGTADDAAILQDTGIANLAIVGTGQLPPNPAELLLHERFAALVERLSKKFDHVLIDTPPVLAVTDAAIIGRVAGCTLLVLKAGEHPMEAIDESVRRLRQAGVQLKGSLFNQVGLHPGRYGYRYGYGYQYGYASQKKS